MRGKNQQQYENKIAEENKMQHFRAFLYTQSTTPI